MDAPTIVTDRLVLLPLTAADLDELAALYADPEVMRHVDGGPRSRAETAVAIAEVEATWQRHGWGLWAIRDATTGGLIGEVGLAQIDHPDLAVDFGFTIGRRQWGRRISTEAGRAVLDDAWDRYRGDTIHAHVDADNVASKAALGKLGFVADGTVDFDDRTDEKWTLARP